MLILLILIFSPVIIFFIISPLIYWISTNEYQCILENLSKDKNKEKKKNKMLKITFDQFKNLYYMNPDAWKISEDLDSVGYEYQTTVRTNYYDANGYRQTRESLTTAKEWFTFGFIDTLRYRKWRKNELNAIPKEILKSWQKDIENFKIKTAKDLEKQVEQIEKYMDEHPSEDEQWKENLKNVLLRICNRIEERKKTP